MTWSGLRFAVPRVLKSWNLSTLGPLGPIGPIPMAFKGGTPTPRWLSTDLSLLHETHCCFFFPPKIDLSSSVMLPIFDPLDPPKQRSWSFRSQTGRAPRGLDVALMLFWALTMASPSSAHSSSQADTRSHTWRNFHVPDTRNMMLTWDMGEFEHADFYTQSAFDQKNDTNRITLHNLIIKKLNLQKNTPKWGNSFGHCLTVQTSGKLPNCLVSGIVNRCNWFG